MIKSNKPLIVVDAGHGGWDNGASYNGRLEKDDNLRLALEVQKQLLAQGFDVLMTRDEDVFIPLEDRATMANDADADLFVSLHRNSFTKPTPTSNGVENYIYLTAPQQTTQRAAQLVLDEIVKVGVQSDRGVSRGNYYVLRKTNMPAMLLEMGFIIDDKDNELFDENLVEYSKAIAKGILLYFGYPYSESPAPQANEPQPDTPPTAYQGIAQIQNLVNEKLGLDIPISGRYDDITQRYMVAVTQKTLGKEFGINLEPTGIIDGKTLQAFPNIQKGDRGDLVFIIQALLGMKGYPINLPDRNIPDGIFGDHTKTAVGLFQRDHYLVADGIVGDKTIFSLLER